MTRVYPMQMTLDDGEAVQIRPLQQSDEARLIRFFGELPAAEIQYQNNDVHDPQVVRGFTATLDTVRVWCLLALSADQRVVGNATLHMDRHGWRRHLGEVRIVVAPKFQQRGLATLLIRELVKRASEKHLHKIETRIAATQPTIKNTLERLGFREEARLVGHVLDLDHQPQDLIIMTVPVDGLSNTPEDAMWDDFGELMTAQDGGFSRGY